jgi:hypothetical protein
MLDFTMVLVNVIAYWEWLIAIGPFILFNKSLSETGSSLSLNWPCTSIAGIWSDIRPLPDL